MRHGKIQLAFLIIILIAGILPYNSHADQIQDYSVLAINSIQFKKEARVLSGHVGVNDRATSPVLDEKKDVEFSSDKKVLFEEDVNLTAPKILLKKETRVKGSVFYRDDLVIKDDVIIEGSQVLKDDPADWPLFSIPATMTCSPDVNNNAVIEREETGSLLPGAYGDIHVEKKATLVLEEGEYHVRTFHIGQEATVIFSGAATVCVEEHFLTRKKAFFGADPEDTALTAATFNCTSTEATIISVIMSMGMIKRIKRGIITMLSK